MLRPIAGAVNPPDLSPRAPAAKACSMASTGVKPMPALSRITGRRPASSVKLPRGALASMTSPTLSRSRHRPRLRSVRLPLDADPPALVARFAGQRVAAQQRRRLGRGLQPEHDELPGQRPAERTAISSVRARAKSRSRSRAACPRPATAGTRPMPAPARPRAPMPGLPSSSPLVPARARFRTRSASRRSTPGCATPAQVRPFRARADTGARRSRRRSNAQDQPGPCMISSPASTSPSSRTRK